MTGAEYLLKTLVANGVEVCFMNPGTSEMHFVSALDDVPGMRPVLGLYEGVCSGAADGYGRMKGRPAAILVHLGPGLANALSNLHNARKARTPVVVIVGEHSTPHLTVEAPLSADIEAFARTVSRRVRTARNPDSLGMEVRHTVAGSLGPPAEVAALIVPADLSWSPAKGRIPVFSPRRRMSVSRSSIRQAASVLGLRQEVGFIIGGAAIASDRALRAAGRIASAAGARFFADRSAPRLAVGRGRFQIPRLPYFPEDARRVLAGLSHLILVEAQAPVSFFGYPNTPSSPVPAGCHVVSLADPGEDGIAALQEVAGGFPRARQGAGDGPLEAASFGSGKLTLDAVGRVLADCLPENAIVSEEMVSSQEPVLARLHRACPHDQLPVTGGSIGQGLPVAVGAALACPHRKVVALEADGSALYSLQALWTMARERLDVLTIIFANRRYRILDVELRRTGAGSIGPRCDSMLDLSRPAIDFVQLSRGFGVESSRSATVAEFARQVRKALSARGPRLIEAVL